MNISKIFDKKGSNINLFADSYLNLDFISGDTSVHATGAIAYALTNPDGSITGVKVINSGWGYDPTTQVNLTYVFGSSPGILSDASIIWKDVQIFGSNCPSAGTTVKGINNIIIDLSAGFIYPSVTYTAAIFLTPVSQGLVETEHLSILEILNSKYIRPYDNINSTLVFKMDSEGDSEIQFFEIDETNQLVEWTDELIIDTSIYLENSPLMINIGFRSDDEGVFERKMRIYHQIGIELYLLSEILINAESIGPDERFDTLITDFGLPSPKANYKLFKDADINEDLPDWQLVNQKAKHIILEHDKIMPYIGTYKALINSIKWLGYEDITIKEWFKNVKDSKKIALDIPYTAADRTKTILYFTPDERRNLKKLNQLSLAYCITRETGEVDEWGTPVVEECYNYNINEILVKLYALKQWLERWIIGVNARIIDITGEGIYFERYKSIIYSTQNIGSDATFKQLLTPITLEENSELVNGNASILLTLEEFSTTNMKSLSKLRDLISYYWDPSNKIYSPSDASSVSYYDPSTIFMGTVCVKNPLKDLSDIQWKASLEKTDAGVVTSNLITNPLFIYNNEIRFLNILDSYSKFYDVSTKLNIVLEKAYLRDPSNDIWDDSLQYSIYPDPSSGAYIFESSTGSKKSAFGYINLVPGIGSELIYEIDSNYRVPLLSMRNYKFTDSSSSIITLNKKYILDIIDGKIVMDSSMLGYKGEIMDIENYINWNYDTSLLEQKITYNIVYQSPRMPLFVYDPSIYWYQTRILHQDPSISVVIDNTIYQMNVHHTGDYQIEVFGWDGQNNLYLNNIKESYSVWNKFPDIYTYLDNSCNYYLTKTCSSTFITQVEVSILINENLHPIFDRQIPLEGLTLELDNKGRPYLKISSISYFIDLPEANSIARFYNLTERCISINSTQIEIDSDYQSFYNEDDVVLVQWSKNSLSFLKEVSSHITAILDNTLTLDYIPADFIGQEASTELYILNDTERTVINPSNNLIDKTISVDISIYTFRKNQLVSLIIDDSSTGYKWGSSFRVSDVSGITHTLKGNVPQFVLDDPRYSLTAKHAFSSFADFQIEVSIGYEVDNDFELYMKDINYHQYYLDSTFVYVDLLFDQEYAVAQWYDPSDNLINKPFYSFTKAVSIDVSTLVIFKSHYDVSNYLLEQKNIWTISNNEDKRTILKTYNDSIPFIFDKEGIFDVQLETYDKYGNLKPQLWEGLISVIPRATFKISSSSIINENELRDIDGNIYHYVTIGTQQWLVENLKTTKYADGISIPNLIENKANDWFFPSLDELREMYNNLHAFGVGGFEDGADYWSSTENDATTAYKINFLTGLSSTSSKFGGTGYRYRACRLFNSTIVYSLRDTGPAGGLIFHIIDLGGGNYTYYEAEPIQNGSGWSWITVAWQGTFLNVTNYDIGTGQANTASIITATSNATGVAKQCNDLMVGGWIDDIIGAYCWYDNDITNKTDYGALYNSYAVTNAHGLAPTGWKIPSNSDWATLQGFLSGETSGGLLKETGFIHWDTPNTGANNSTGFTSVGSGKRDSAGSFTELKLINYLWNDLGTAAMFLYFKTINSELGGMPNPKYGISVRCMRDI